MLEIKVVVFAKDISVLAPVMEGALSLMFPFQYFHFYCPVLPRVLSDYLQAPIPFFVGCSSDWAEAILKNFLEDVKDNFFFRTSNLLTQIVGCDY